MGGPFDEDEVAAVATLEPDADVDVDTASAAAEDETEDTSAATAAAPAKRTATKKTASTRAPVPEGYISPVAFAKELSKHLTAKARERDELGDDEEIEVKPQIIYSYINSTKDGK